MSFAYHPADVALLPEAIRRPEEPSKVVHDPIPTSRVATAIVTIASIQQWQHMAILSLAHGTKKLTQLLLLAVFGTDPEVISVTEFESTGSALRLTFP